MEIIILLIVIGWFIYEYLYFKSDKFNEIKKNIENYTNDCNDLNNHIEELKNSYLNIEQIDYGTANYVDSSNFNFKRTNWKNINNSSDVYKCSATVCRGAQQQPFKYVCKYFNITPNEDTLENFEEILNNFSAAEQGKILLKNQRDKIISEISNKVPFLIRTLKKKKFIRKLGFQDIDLSQLYFPKFYFQYVSSGGNSSMSTHVTLDISNLDKFINYLSEIIKFKKSIAGQRTLMTSNLREKIKERDNYTCKKCGATIEKEPNLLLEIDHIIPLSKNGLTTEENLQTLCWRCNRSKGSKIEEEIIEKNQ